jgi:UDP-N-acetyl-D-glucosamine/UDP-N-acetyl-D-galactosamine dehydrogenase
MLNRQIAIIGLGYVGLPLAVEFGKIRRTVGFDINKLRISALNDGLDHTQEITPQELLESKNLTFTFNIEDIEDCSIYIITVPTPIKSNKEPDLTPLEGATKAIGKVINKGDIVIYESTVYPGATEEFCVPILEKNSGLTYNKDFYCGYSPERINPGDKLHRLTDIKKITSGSNVEIADFIDNLYNEIIIAGTFRAKSIKVAEAAKVIENTQRDVNIALINELALIFNKLNLDTEEVLKAAETKWNFLSFRPGLVGGHCIGVDPYYLTQKALDVGHHPEMILAGRRLNDSMTNEIVNQVIELMKNKDIPINQSNILIMGLTFKENCPDIRNTLIAKLVEDFKESSCNVDVFDPWVDKEEAYKEYQIHLINKPINGKYDAIVLAVAHDQFKLLTIEQLKDFCKESHVIYDLKYLLPAEYSDGRL